MCSEELGKDGETNPLKVPEKKAKNIIFHEDILLDLLGLHGQCFAIFTRYKVVGREEKNIKTVRSSHSFNIPQCLGGKLPGLWREQEKYTWE